jgi:hypothetical protein
MDPRTVAAVFFLLVTVEVIWTMRLVRERIGRRKAIESLVFTGEAPGAMDLWLASWARRAADGSPSVRGGQLVLSEAPPALLGTVATSPILIAPGLLTALGVLGTFIGIHGGLAAINLDAMGSTESLLSAASGLMAGMKTAFATSVAGMKYAAITMVLLAGTGTARRQWAAAERDRWRAVVTVGGADGIGQAAAAMAEAAERLSVAMAGQQDHLIREVITTFQEQALAPLTARLEESAAISRQTAEAVGSLEQSLGGITNRLADSVEILDRFNSETHKKLQAFTTNMATTLDRFQVGSQQALEQTGAAIREAVDESISGMALQRSAFEESAQSAAATFRGIRKELESALTTQSAEQRKNLTALRDANLAVIERAEETYTHQAQAIERIGAQAVATMSEAGTQLDEQLTTFRAEYAEQLATFLDHQTKQLDTVLERNRRGLTDVIERLEQSFTDEYGRRKELSAEVDRTISKLKEGVSALDDLAATLGLNSEARLAQLISLSEQMTGQTDSLEASYRALATQYESALSEMDTASTKLCDGLYRAADTLVTASRRVA